MPPEARARPVVYGTWRSLRPWRPGATYPPRRPSTGAWMAPSFPRRAMLSAGLSPRCLPPGLGTTRDGQRPA